MSNNTWLDALRSEPSPSFKEQLHARLRAQEPVPVVRREWSRRALLPAAAIAAVALLVSVPAVRASAAQFLSLFRVVNVVAVPVDANRLDRLKAENLEIGTLIGDRVEVVVDPGPPISVPSPEDAAAAANMTLAVPQWLPAGTQVLETSVMGERVVRVTADGQRLQQVMDALGINDLSVPAGLDGQVVTVHVPPVVMIRYEHGKLRTRLFQARTPEVAMPGSIDVETLGEIGLRVLGLPAAEARQFAEAIDWNTTLVVPVPPNATSFQQVTIDGHPGVYIQYQPRDQSPTHMVVWSTPDRVFAMVSIQHIEQVLAMANSIR